MSDGKLVICPTPLGNLQDITLRSLEALKSADVICAEDTRVTGKLLAAFDIKKPLERLDEHMLSTGAPQLLERVRQGETIVYCTDAGMPGISDPGARLIKEAYETETPVEVLPGANAVSLAYVASGFSVPRFYFGGFFPRKDGERAETLSTLANLDAALVFYESPKRLLSSLGVLSKQVPSRRIAVCREMTKLYEEVFRGTAEEVYEEFKQRSDQSGIKGEIVLVIDVASEQEHTDKQTEAREDAFAYAEHLKQGDYSHKEITKILQQEFGISRNDAYDIALKA